MNRNAIIILLLVLLASAGIGIAFATGVFDNESSGDDWRDHIGEATTYETEGSYTHGIWTINTWTGTATNTLLYKDETTGYWFINYATDNKYRDGRHETTNNNSWGLDENYVETLVGVETINTKYFGKQECNHIILENDVTGHTEDQWIGVDDGIAYYVEVEVQVGSWFDKITYSQKMYYVSTSKVEVDMDFEVKVYKDMGIEVTGEGTYGVGEKVTLTATGDEFYGWYDYDISVSKPVSTERTYEFSITSDKTLYALSGAVDKSYTSGEEVTLTAGVELSSATWKIEGYDRTLNKATGTVELQGSSPTYTFETPGDYNMTIEGTTTDGQAYYGYRILFVDGYLTHDWEYTYGGHDIEISLDILFSDYVSYMDKLPESDRRDLPSDRQNHGSQFVVVDDKYIPQLTKQFAELQQLYGWTDIVTAECILTFTQNIDYEYDSDSHGTSEYWNFPVETLYLDCGDCEDTSILCSAIFKGMGYDSALILMYGHMAVGISTDGMTGASDLERKYDPYDESGYYYGETTSIGYELGEVPSGVRYVDKIVIDAES